MPATVVRFNLVEPGATPASLSARYKAALEMAAYADDRGMTTVQTEEHHGVANNWLPSPFTFAGAVFGATRRIAVTVSAIIGPLHDPLRLAEDIAVLDLLSGGRLITVAGIGYRPEEYAIFDVEWKRRGRLQDELLETLLKAWTGEEFEYHGRTVRVTPAPLLGSAPSAAGRRLLQGGGPPRGPARTAVLPERASAGAGGLLQGAAGRVRQGGLDHDALGGHPAPAPRRGPGPRLGRARRALPARGADVRLLAVVGHPLGGEVGGHDGRRAARRGRLPDPYAGRVPVHRASTATCCIRCPAGCRVDEGWRSMHLFCENVLPRLKGL